MIVQSQCLTLSLQSKPSIHGPLGALAWVLKRIFTNCKLFASSFLTNKPCYHSVCEKNILCLPHEFLV